jgi:hypothetical protein
MAEKTFSTTRKSSFNLDKLKQKINKSSGGKKDGDARFFKHGVDKSENGETTIRLLPGIDTSDDDLAYVEVFSHFFKGPGGVFFEACPNTIGERCPICFENSKLYKSNTKEDQAIGKQRKKQHHYISNILVVDDKANPENNNKVFLFKYGPDLFDRFIGQMDGDSENPNFVQVIPFALDATGADFKLVSHKEGDYRKYSKSFYKKPAVSDISDELLAQQYSLKEFVNPSKIKSEEELLKRFHKVLKQSSTVQASEEPTAEAEEMPALSAEEEETLEKLGSTAEESEIDVDDEIKKLLG